MSGHAHGFLFDGSTYTTVDHPGANHTAVWGVSGSTIVGTYSDSSGTHCFIAQVPEPSTLALLGLGIVPLVYRVTRRGVVSQTRCGLGVNMGDPLEVDVSVPSFMA